MTKLEQFTELVNRHDLTFVYSDDYSVWARGEASLKKIRALGAELPEVEAAAIWNSMVDRNLIPSARVQYYWKPTLKL
jgi:hypothetical protein